MCQERGHEIGGGTEETIKIIKKMDQLHMERLRSLGLTVVVKVCYEVDNLNVELFNEFHTIWEQAPLTKTYKEPSKNK